MPHVRVVGGDDLGASVILMSLQVPYYGEAACKSDRVPVRGS